MKSRMIPKVFKMYPQGSLNICCEYHGNPCNSCRDILLANVNLLMGPEEKSEDHQIHKDSSSGNHECMWEISWQSVQWL